MNVSSNLRCARDIKMTAVSNINTACYIAVYFQWPTTSVATVFCDCTTVHVKHTLYVDATTETLISQISCNRASIHGKRTTCENAAATTRSLVSSNRTGVHNKRTIYVDAAAVGIIIAASDSAGLVLTTIVERKGAIIIYIDNIAIAFSGFTIRKTTVDGISREVERNTLIYRQRGR